MSDSVDQNKATPQRNQIPLIQNEEHTVGRLCFSALERKLVEGTYLYSLYFAVTRASRHTTTSTNQPRSSPLCSSTEKAEIAVSYRRGSVETEQHSLIHNGASGYFYEPGQEQGVSYANLRDFVAAMSRVFSHPVASDLYLECRREIEGRTKVRSNCLRRRLCDFFLHCYWSKSSHIYLDATSVGPVQFGQ